MSKKRTGYLRGFPERLVEAMELAEMTGTTAASVLSSISHKHKGWDRVEVEDEDEDILDSIPR